MLRYPLIQMSPLVLCVVAVGACSSPAQDPAPSYGSALENPIVACQGEYDHCRLGPGADIAQCQASMRTCLTSVAQWVQESRMLLEQCREQLVQCRSARGDTPAQCQTKFDACIAPAFRPGTNGEDAGVDEDAGVGRRYPGGERTAGAGAPPVAGRSPGAAGRGGSAAPRGPGFPTLPGAAGSGGLFQTPGDTCNAGLFQCIAAGGDPLQCATQARECLRSGFGLLP